MITSKAGNELVILEGSKKSVEGKKHFLVKFLDSSLPRHIQHAKVMGSKAVKYWNKPFKLRKDELNFNTEVELYEAIAKKEKKDDKIKPTDSK